MITNNACDPVNLQRTKTFWTTQPDACGIMEECTSDCGRAGLELYQVNEDDSLEVQPKTFTTTDWIRGLALNMLLTDARKGTTDCGRRPGSLNGHWSESYIAGAGLSTGGSISGNPSIGTGLRYINPSIRIQELTQLVQAEVYKTLYKLVTYQVAFKIEVTATYRGRMTILVEATIYTRTGQTANVAVSGAVKDNQWVWN